MGFFGIGKPKWRHADVSVRRAALERISPADEHILVRMALDDTDPGIRAAAASKITREDNLKKIAAASDDKVAGIARSRLAGVAQKIVREGNLADVHGILSGISEQSALADFACTAKDSAVRVAALDRLLAQEDPSPALLAMIAIQDESGAYADRAMDRIHKRSALKNIAKKAKSTTVQAHAQRRIDEHQEEERKPSNEARRKARREALEALIPRFSRVVVAKDLSVAQNEFDLANAAMEEALLHSDDLGDDESVSKVQQRNAQAAAALEILRDQVQQKAMAEAEAIALRSSFIERVSDGTEIGEREMLESSWASLSAVPTQVGARLEANFATAIASRFQVTVGTGYRVLDDSEVADLVTLVTTAEELVAKADTPDSKAAEFTFQDLHKRWSALTHGTDPQLEDRVRFIRAWDAFKDARRAARDARRKIGEERTAQLQVLLKAAEGFAKNPAPESEQKARFEALKSLRQEWRAVGNVRGADQLRAEFEAILDQAFEPLNALREAEDWERFANVAKAETLTESIQALAEETDLGVVARNVREAHKAWKDLGGLPRDRQNDLWQAFKTACDDQYDRCKVYFAEKDAKRAESKVRKQRLVEQAEELAVKGTVGIAGSPADRSAKDDIARHLKDLQSEWKLAGSAGRDDEDRLWQAFRKACDGFFQSYNAGRDQELQQNLLRKDAVLTEMEKLAEVVKASPEASVSDRDKWLRQIRDYQGRWKEVGYVPRDRHEDMNQRYRAACDTVYNAARAETEESTEEQQENLLVKTALCEKLEELTGTSDAKTDAEQLRLRWESTGPVPSAERKTVESRWQAAWQAVFATAE